MWYWGDHRLIIFSYLRIVNLKTWFKTSAMFVSEFIEWLYERCIGGKITISHIEKLTTMVFTTCLGLIYFFRLVASVITVLGFTYGVEPMDPLVDKNSVFWDLWFNNLYSMVTVFSTVGYGDNLPEFADENFVL
jgi:hypothetical protein